MKTIIAAAVATVVAGTAMADSILLTTNVNGEASVVALNHDNIQCHQIKQEIAEIYQETGLPYDYVTIRDLETNRIIGWTFMSGFEAARAGVMLTTTCLES